MLTTATLIRPEASILVAPAREVQLPGESSAGTSAQGSTAEVEIHEEKVFTHLDEENEHDAETWVLDTGVMNHVFGCQAAFTKIDTTVLGTVCLTVGLSCSCARTASPDPSTGSTSSLV
jgi:hypothetical protein